MQEILSKVPQTLTSSPEWWTSLTLPEREEIRQLSEELPYRWGLIARDKQRIPEGMLTGLFDIWLLMTGRGFGKTRAGSETVRVMSDKVPLIHLVGRTAADARDVMIEGPSGILAVHPDYNKPKYEPSKRRITWPNGCRATVFSGDEPDLLRGPECYFAWVDELAAYKYGEDTWDNLMMGLRQGKNPWAMVTTTPRSIKLIKDMVTDERTSVTRGSTWENEHNLSEVFLRKMTDKYEGTRTGRQELYAEILEDIEGALWTYKLIERAQVKEHPTLTRIVVAIDPAMTSNPDSDETGIVVAGLGVDKHMYVLEDLSGIYTPAQSGKTAIGAYYRHQADRIIGEVNNGGDWIEGLLKQLDPDISYKSVHASRGKAIRAEPIVSLYEQNRVKHVGSHPALETQMTTWAAKEGEKSPDRVDALVWAGTELMIKKSNFFVV